MPMTSPFSERVAANVRAELARRSLSQTDLARMLGTTQQAVSRRISGKVPFDTEELNSIAEQLGVPVASLIPVEIGGAA
jgi:predicted transcriptional regulator